MIYIFGVASRVIVMQSLSCTMMIEMGGGGVTVFNRVYFVYINEKNRFTIYKLLILIKLCIQQHIKNTSLIRLIFNFLLTQFVKFLKRMRQLLKMGVRNRKG